MDVGDSAHRRPARRADAGSGAEAAPSNRTGFALGLALSVNQIAIVAVPPVPGPLAGLTGSFTPAWSLLSLTTVVAPAVTAKAELRPAENS